MIYEYALEPDLVVDWATAGTGRWVGQFGLDNRRLVSDFPKYWEGAVYGAFLARFDNDYSHPDVVNIQPILNAYLQLLTEYMVPRQVTFAEGAVWLDEAIREHTNRPFHAIFASQCAEGTPQEVITQEHTDDVGNARWWLQTIRTTRKSAADIGTALRPLLQASSDIHIVDPYFDAGERRFQESFAEIVRRATTSPRAVSGGPTVTLVTGVERFFKDWQKPTNDAELKKRLNEETKVAAHIRHLASQHLPRMVPAGMPLRLVVLRNSPGGDPLHNRFVLTDIGGVILPYGVDDYDREAEHSAKDDLLPMPSGMYRERWAQYVKIKAASIVLGPELIAGRE